MMTLHSHKPMHWVEMSTDTTQRQGREQLLARFSYSHLSYPLSPKLLHTLKLISLLTTGTGSCDTYQDALQTPADILPYPLSLNVCPDADSLPQRTHKMQHLKLCNSVKSLSSKNASLIPKNSGLFVYLPPKCLLNVF